MERHSTPKTSKHRLSDNTVPPMPTSSRSERPKRSKTTRQSERQGTLALPPLPADAQQQVYPSPGPSTSNPDHSRLPLGNPSSQAHPLLEQARRSLRLPPDLDPTSLPPQPVGDGLLLVQLAKRVGQLEERIEHLQKERSASSPATHTASNHLRGPLNDGPTGQGGHTATDRAADTASGGITMGASLEQLGWPTTTADLPRSTEYGRMPVDIGQLFAGGCMGGETSTALDLTYADSLRCEHDNSLWNCDECYDYLRSG
ncbi:hypothetical protein LTR36_001313 [Oleoguttula mirabilis]|uniref:Uncharacterized protein n=1 Tax=Oleoguttula mirabilis TaxID=1507867 RepID=A0AAV9JNV0_9PEZI|nr:hypothetical protein LTR36_001313 [Oleoguttula mirabilis]